MAPEMGNHQQRPYDQCNEIASVPNPITDNPPPFCETDPNPNLRSINDDSMNWLKDQNMKKTGFGASANNDPMQKGKILNDPDASNRAVLYRYSKGLRGCDEAMIDLFKGMVVIDEDGKAWPIPILLGPPEKAVAAMIQENVRKDETLVVNRIKLPMLAMTQSNIEFDAGRYSYHKALNFFTKEDGRPGFTISEKYEKDTIFGMARGIPVNMGYTLTAWTMYREDMNQIVEQIMTKFSQVAYIRVTGVPWEVIVKLDSVANNINNEPGDQQIRVIKYEFNMTAQTYIPQPIERKKAILKTKVDFVDGTSDETITEVLGRIELSVKELEC